MEEDGKPGYEIKHGKPYEGLLVPFGCACVYHSGFRETERADKVEPQGRPGVVVGYGVDGSFRVADLAAWSEDRTLRLRTTRDVQVDRTVVPLRILNGGPGDAEPNMGLLVDEDEGLRAGDRHAAKAALLECAGVGPKVADCVALFCLDQCGAVPGDTYRRLINTYPCLKGADCVALARGHALRLQLHLAVLDREKVCVPLLQPACHRCFAFDARYGCG